MICYSDPTSVRIIPADLIAEYADTRPHSRAEFERAKLFLPGGQTRSVTHYAPFPSVLTSGSGHTLRDVDGLEYIDLVNNYTSLVHGNAFGPVTNAVRDALGGGSAFAAIHPAQINLAERITNRVASIDLVRFTNSGSEAASLAARMVRKYTGRTEIIVAQGGYHGAVPPFADTSAEPSIRVVPYNDINALAHSVSERTAAIFLEPFLGAGGVIVGTAEYLTSAAQLAKQHGALFVLDEVQSLRNNFGGAQSELDITPDVTLLGKVIGGGFPIGAVGGRSDVLEVTSPYSDDPLSHAGTFNGHIASVVAGSVTIDHLETDAISRLNSRAVRLQALIANAGAQAGIPLSIPRAGSILNIYSGDEPTTAAQAAGQRVFHAALHLALLIEGVYTATRGMINLSTAITEDTIDELGSRYAAALQRLASYSSTDWEGKTGL